MFVFFLFFKSIQKVVISASLSVCLRSCKAARRTFEKVYDSSHAGNDDEHCQVMHLFIGALSKTHHETRLTLSSSSSSSSSLSSSSSSSSSSSLSSPSPWCSSSFARWNAAISSESSQSREVMSSGWKPAMATWVGGNRSGSAPADRSTNQTISQSPKECATTTDERHRGSRRRANGSIRNTTDTVTSTSVLGSVDHTQSHQTLNASRDQSKGRRETDKQTVGRRTGDGSEF